MEVQQQPLAPVPHLRLEVRPEEKPKIVRIENKKESHLEGTLEADNKKRQNIQKQNSQRFLKMPPETPDPNSEAKSMIIDNMQMRLENWNQEIMKIQQKKQRNDEILQHEIEKRDKEISDLTSKYTSEHKVRTKTEKERNNLSEKLWKTEQTLNECNSQNQQLNSELSQCQAAYQQTEARRLELEEETVELQDKVEQIEEMKRRLNDQVTELQGQVSMLQRSSACSIL